MSEYITKSVVAGRAAVTCRDGEGIFVQSMTGDLNDDVRRCLRNYFGRTSMKDLNLLVRKIPRGKKMVTESAAPFVCGWIPVRWDDDEVVFDVTYRLRPLAGDHD